MSEWQWPIGARIVMSGLSKTHTQCKLCQEGIAFPRASSPTVPPSSTQPLQCRKHTVVHSLICFGVLPWSRSSMLSQSTKHGTLSHLPTLTSSLFVKWAYQHMYNFEWLLGSVQGIHCFAWFSSMSLITMRLSASSSTRR